MHKSSLMVWLSVRTMRNSLKFLVHIIHKHIINCSSTWLQHSISTSGCWLCKNRNVNAEKLECKYCAFLFFRIFFFRRPSWINKTDTEHYHICIDNGTKHLQIWRNCIDAIATAPLNHITATLRITCISTGSMWTLCWPVDRLQYTHFSFATTTTIIIITFYADSRVHISNAFPTTFYSWQTATTTENKNENP